MKTSFFASCKPDRRRTLAPPRWLLGMAVALLCALASTVAQAATTGGATVKTLGGGWADFADGNTATDALFNGPWALALDQDGNLLVADRMNNAIRKLSLSAGTTLTVYPILQAPIGLLFDRTNNLLVLTYGANGNGQIHKFDIYQNEVSHPLMGKVFNGATAFAMDTAQNLYIAQNNGDITWASMSSGAVSNLTRLTNAVVGPQGIVVQDDGLVVVSDTDNHVIRWFDPRTGTQVRYTGQLGKSGFVNGLASQASFNSPHQIAKSASGTLVVADFGNHRVRLVETNGITTTLYGVDPTHWYYCPDCNPSVWQGWSDATVTGDEWHDPAAREPHAVLVSPDGGKVYTTELYYDIIREVTGINLGSSRVNGDTNNAPIVLPPTVTPNSGYYPNGVDVIVTSPYPWVYYTLDGTVPTTNSFKLIMTDGTGVIHWMSATVDLTSLKVKAFDWTQTNVSATVGGVSPSSNVLGFSTESIKAGLGSTVIIPIVANLMSNQTIDSIQFNIEIVSTNGATPVQDWKLIDPSANDFVRVVGNSADGNPVNLETFPPYDIFNNGIRSGKGLVVYSTTRPNFQVKNFGVVALVSLNVPAAGNTLDSKYKITVSHVTATSDGYLDVIMKSGPPTILSMTTNGYLVGNVSPARWYGIGDFGTPGVTNLGSVDVNAVFRASLGIGTPFPGTDAFHAMDVYPEDDTGFPGGNQIIEVADWKILLRRAQRYPGPPSQINNNWWRYWDETGALVNSGVGFSLGQGDALAPVEFAQPGSLWAPDVTLRAGCVSNASPGLTVSVPIYARVQPGETADALQFRAVIDSGRAAALHSLPRFVSAIGIPQPWKTLSTPGRTNDIGVVWDGLNLAGSNLLGYVQFQMPPEAVIGATYPVRLVYSQTTFGPNVRLGRVENIPGAVFTGASRAPEIVSDEWKTNFFGSLTNQWADAFADPDGDGVPNWKEYLSGTNPTNRLSRMEMLASHWRNGANQGLQFKWPAAPGKTYVIECATNLVNPQWIPVATNTSSGPSADWGFTNAPQRIQLYRLRLLP